MNNSLSNAWILGPTSAKQSSSQNKLQQFNVSYQNGFPVADVDMSTEMGMKIEANIRYPLAWTGVTRGKTVPIQSNYPNTFMDFSDLGFLNSGKPTPNVLGFQEQTPTYMSVPYLPPLPQTSPSFYYPDTQMTPELQHEM